MPLAGISGEEYPDDSDDDYQPNSSALASGSDSDEESNVAAVMNNRHGQKELRTISKISTVGESSDNGGKLKNCLMR